MKTTVYTAQINRPAGFRFLYGRWKPRISRSLRLAYSCSDSSMVDENRPAWRLHNAPAWFRFLYGRWKPMGRRKKSLQRLVQIPLWSMKTWCSPLSRPCVGRFRFLYGRWKPGRTPPWPRYARVQIPLWSMKTDAAEAGDVVAICSDSSMVDENSIVSMSQPSWNGFRFLYGRWKRVLPLGGDWVRLGSDSSMVDENCLPGDAKKAYAAVQIPLWSMKTCHRQHLQR